MGRWTTETGLVAAITVAVKKAYPTAWIFNVHGGTYQMAGVPDLLIVIDGLLIGAEVKHQKPGESEQHARERATIIQRKKIADIIAAGGMAGVVLTPAETLELIERAFKKHEVVRADRLAQGTEKERP
jgi:hypothetical protein